MAAAGHEFTGYDETRHEGSAILMLWDENQKWADRQGLSAGDTGFVALDKTPFYVEAGGQVSDRGRLTGAGVDALVDDIVKSPGMTRIHKVTVTSGTLNVGDKVTAEVDVTLRDATRRNHTGTHLLHSALRRVLGPHVKQAGSLVAPDRLRFDFVHFSAVSAEDLRRIEDIVNQAILRNEPVTTAVRDTQEAIAGGAMALFGEKYGDKVRVVSVGDGRFSTELCGGTHVRATGDIGPFLITEEAGVAAGVRRIEALTGLGALDYARPRLHEFERVRAVLNAGTDEIVAKLEARLQTLEKAIKDRDRKLAKAAAGDSGGQGQRVTIGDVTLVCRRVDDASKDLLRSIADQIKSTLTSGVVFLAGPTADGKVAMVVSVTGNVSGRLKAGQLVKELAPIVGGGGGGRPDFAEAGGKDPAQVDAMLAAAPEVVQRLLGA